MDGRMDDEGEKPRKCYLFSIIFILRLADDLGKSEISDFDSEEISSLTKEQLIKLNLGMRSKIEDENDNYKRKIQTFQESQSRQAQLVQKLQQKVISMYDIWNIINL